MARKRRKPQSEVSSAPRREESSKYGIDEKFDDSEDEFFAGRDKVLVDEGPIAKRRRKLQEQEQDLQLSDEEIYRDTNGVDEEDSAPSDNLDADVNDVDHEDANEESDEDWGASRSNYYNADTIETEADALEEEAEARRLRLKQLKGMTAADFGFDEKAWTTRAEPKSRRPAVEKLPDLQIPENSTSEERLKLLKIRYPEFESLSKDFVKLKLVHYKIEQNIRTYVAKEQKDPGSDAQVPAFLTKHRALSAYLAVIATYFAVLTSSKTGIALPPSELRQHPIMNTILRCRQAWEKVKDWPEDINRSPRPLEIEEKAAPVAARGKILKNSPDKESTRKRKAVPDIVTNPEKDKATQKREKKSKQNTEQLPSTTPIQSKSKSADRKPKRLALKDLLASTLDTNNRSPPSDFGDEDPLTTEQAAEKAQKKKSLRFYTSQIAQKASKRNAASREAGGDDDLPHKERLRDKQDRMLREAEARGKSRPNELEQLDNDSNDDLNIVQAINNEANDNEYYNSLVAKSQRKKAEKKARAEAVAQGGQVYREEEQIGPDGKRKITYAIEKNRGLAPKRRKEVRNPRVKKRKKYDEKMKKLGTIRQVYKGGEGRGGYGGELSGIKTNVVKSIKL